MSTLSRALSPFPVQTKFEEKPRYTIMLGCLVIGEDKAFIIGTDKTKTISELRDTIKAYKENVFRTFDANQLILWKVNIPETNKREINVDTDIVQRFGTEELDDFDTIEEHFGTNPIAKHIHIIVQMPTPPPATTGAIIEALSIPMKRQAEPQDYDSNREPVALRVREFWNELSKAQIVLKLPNNADKTRYTSDRLSKYMKVEENKIVLNDNVMLNSQDELIFCDGSSVIESEVVKMDFVKFLRFRRPPNEIIAGIDSQDILIRKSYLQMIEKIECDRADGTEGCVIVGSPGIGKTHFSLYLAFYITRRYNSDDIMYEQRFGEKSRLFHIRPNHGAVSAIIHPEFEFPQGDFFYIVDTVKPAPWKAKYTFLITSPQCNLWHNFVKRHPRVYYAPIWSEKEIWDVWNWKYKDIIPETRVKELIKKWGCILRQIFVKYMNELNLRYLVSQCNLHKFMRGDLDNEYSGKVIHIIPNADFTDKTFEPASAEASEALYQYYAKDEIIYIIRDFARSSGRTFAGNFFEMLAHDVLRKGLELNRYDNVQGINSGYYNFPKIKNFESVDAIAPENNGIHHLYQITIARKHDTKVNGLLKLKNHLGGNLPIHLYFVVPNINCIFDNFSFQNYVTTGDEKHKGWNATTKWIRDNIKQYVLEIELN
ncbi:unnamed protein product [Rhizophagus irregularis]|nr:unnamed protein product [Rhizophagus irregularis]